MANEDIISTLVNGISSDLSSAAKYELEKSIRGVSNQLEAAKMNRTSNVILGSKGQKSSDVTTISKHTRMDAEVYTNLSEMINGKGNATGGFDTLLDSLYAKNKKGYAIIKDYELMPILIPQINRVLMFLVNECLSPDIQNDQTFTIKFLSDSDFDRVQQDIDQIKKEMKLDTMLRDVYMNRYKLGREYYVLVDYNRTFDHMIEMLSQKKLNEATAGMSDMDFLESEYRVLTETLNEASCNVRITALADPTTNPNFRGTQYEMDNVDIVESVVNLQFSHMNIVIERSPICKYVQAAHAELLHEAYSNYSTSYMLNRMACTGSLNEAVIDTSKLETLVTNLKKKKLQRCTIDRLDPAKVFRLRIGGKTVGYFHTTDINAGTSMTVNFAQALKDQLLKSRATNLSAATANAEEIISKNLAEMIINKFDPNIGINRIEDIDLLHDYIRQNEIYRGNKRITFYYADEIYDMSRSDDSILINAVFFTKLYATLLLNNIMTKVLRGRGRQIHTVQMGVSPNTQRYVQNAMASLTMPENNLGTLHGSFEQILNPFNAASDIVIPSEDGTERFITTDYIPGQDVDMDNDFLRSLLNAIVSSFGLDSAVIDATNGNLQFARTLSMESLQICNSVRNEQQDLYDSWSAMCLDILSIMGTEATKNAVAQGKIEVSFFEPKSLVLQNTIDDLNNAKTYAEAFADIIPEFNADGSETKRSKFIYRLVKEKTNLDWGMIEDILKDVRIDTLDDELEDEIRKIIQEYKENVKETMYGDQNGDGITTSEDYELSDEEQDLMNSEDDEL